MFAINITTEFARTRILNLNLNSFKRKSDFKKLKTKKIPFVLEYKENFFQLTNIEYKEEDLVNLDDFFLTYLFGKEMI